MGDVQVGDVNGVPAFWVETGRPTLTASLIFRRGMVDETLPTTGWTHLLEHLALHGRGAGSLTVNGSVSLLHTRFDARGPADRVGSVLSEVSQWLTDPNFAELAREQSVLRAEAALRGGNEVSFALLQRYGAAGPGLCGYAEPGLSRATPDALRELAQATFVTGNAVLFLDGPPPPTLKLDLRAGPLDPAPVAKPCSAKLPAAYLIGTGITLSGVVPRSVAATLLPHVLRKALTDQFRERDGGAYAPWAHYEPVDDDYALVVCGSDANTELLRTIAATGRGQVDRLARGDIPDELVADIREQILAQVADPYLLPNLAYRAATDHLRGKPPVTIAETVDEIETLSTADIVEEAVRLRDSLLVGIAGKAAWKKDIPMLAMPVDAERIHARGHRSRNFPADRRAVRVTADRVQVGAAGEYRSVRVADVAGMLVFPDGARDILSADGWNIRVEPTLWARGYTLTQRIDEVIPDSLHIPMAGRTPDHVPKPLRPPALVRHTVTGLRRNPRFMLSLWAALWLLVVTVITVRTGTPPVWGIFTTLVVVGVAVAKVRQELDDL